MGEQAQLRECLDEEKQRVAALRQEHADLKAALADKQARPRSTRPALFCCSFRGALTGGGAGDGGEACVGADRPLHRARRDSRRARGDCACAGA